MTSKDPKTKPATAIAKHATSNTKGSLVKVIVKSNVGEWLSPKADEIFYIDENASFPKIICEIKTDDPSPYTWSWDITWSAKISDRNCTKSDGRIIDKFSEHNSFSSKEKQWIVTLNNQTIGGTLTVKVKTTKQTFVRRIHVKGTNPTKDKVVAFIRKIPNTLGFDKVISQESRYRQFTEKDGEPIVAFDHGYGMCQLTNPKPTYDEAWDWKANVIAGSKLYETKQKIAKSYLGQSGRHYSNDQLELETLARWNGGTYHLWDKKSNKWVRNPDIMCDPETGNIGWNVNNTANKGKTEQQLHDRDKGSYSNPKKNKKTGNKWTYSGECYADHTFN